MATRAKARVADRKERPIPHGAAVLLDKWVICEALGIGIRKFEEMRSSGEYPEPDVKLGLLNRWSVECHNAAVEALKAKRRAERGGGL